MSDKSREEFEKWYKIEYPNSSLERSVFHGDGYNDIEPHRAWLAWQEQRKKIDALEAELHTIRAIITEKG